MNTHLMYNESVLALVRMIVRGLSIQPQMKILDSELKIALARSQLLMCNVKKLLKNQLNPQL